MWNKSIGTAIVAIGIAVGGSAFAASQQTGNSAFCWQKAGDTMDCKYASLAACTKAAGSATECIQNPQRATTGSGMRSKPMQNSK